MPAALNHVATIARPAVKVSFQFDSYAAGKGCKIKMQGGCNLLSTLLYVAFDGHLFKISQNTGAVLQDIDLGADLQPAASGANDTSNFNVAHVMVPFDEAPPTQVFLAGMRRPGDLEVW